jgi:acetyl-CoA carboxylase carboxyltransferase component
VSAVVGTAAGGPAGRAILSHWSVMVKGQSQIFAAGPPVVERSLGEQVAKEDLGGAHVAVDMAGSVDNAVENEQACFDAIKRFLSYLPQNVWAAPPIAACADSPTRSEEALLDIVPRDRRKPYNMRKLIGLIADRASVFELQPSFGRALITCLARMGGYVVGIIANNPMLNGGAMDSKAARKQIRFMELCDTFHIPIVFLVDVPGFMVGTQAEQLGTLRDGMRAVYVAMQASVPMFTVVIRKCYGMAGMATCDKNQLDFKIAWPSAEWGSLPIEGGVAAAYRRELAAAEDPAQRLREIEEDLRQYASPFRTAEAFAVEDIIDPRDTRAYLCRFIEAAQTRIATSLGPKHKSGVRP